MCRNRIGILWLFLAGFFPLWAQQVDALQQRSLKRWGIPPAHYSGITSMGNSRYAVISDKGKDGFFVFRICLDSLSGRVQAVRCEGFRPLDSSQTGSDSLSGRDREGVIYRPSTSSVFISGEADQQILEYDTLGRLTGSRLAVPQIFGNDRIQPNYGFEALGYSPETGLFWTTTENALKTDKTEAGIAPMLRLQCFGDDLKPQNCYAYRMELPRKNSSGRVHAYGVSALTALPDGRLLVLEREVYVPVGYIGARTDFRLFVIDPEKGQPLTDSTDMNCLPDTFFLSKKELWHGTTRFNLLRYDFANYEGMCLGPTLHDGRRTLLLISDSQNGYRRWPVRMKDYLKVLILPEDF